MDGTTTQPELAHPTLAERRARGKAARQEIPREAHAAFEPQPGRPSPVDLLGGQDAARVPELVPIRYGRMLVSPFTFFRGAALIMANDLAATPRSGINAQLCGDAHLSNFGVFASPDRRLVFDLNDFDETLPGPWEWDVKRLVTSLVVAGRERAFSSKERARVARSAARAYREGMRGLARMTNLQRWYARFDAEAFMSRLGASADKQARARAEKSLAKARTKDSMAAFEKLAAIVDGEPRIIADPPLIVPIEDLVEGADVEDTKAWFRDMLRGYRSSLQPDRRRLLEEFRFVHLARKVVGVGSVGTRSWIILMTGRDDRDPLFLQAKEAGTSVLEGFTAPSEYENHGERVVAGQHLMQAASDILLGWQRVPGLDGVTRDYYVRQLKDWKGSADVDVMVPGGMELYGRMCGATLARAHSRSGDRIAIASYLGKGDAFDRALAEFGEAYADQNERDYAELRDAVATGRITAEEGL
jgi:uncharacterized protein (DUF2252 family)